MNPSKPEIEAQIITELDNILGDYAQYVLVDKIDIDKKHAYVRVDLKEIPDEIKLVLVNFGIKFIILEEKQWEQFVIRFDYIVDEKTKYIGLIEH